MSSLLGFVTLLGRATEQVLGYLEHHHWFLGCWSLAIYFTFTTKACMPDLTRSITA